MQKFNLLAKTTFVFDKVNDIIAHNLGFLSLFYGKPQYDGTMDFKIGRYFGLLAIAIMLFIFTLIPIHYQSQAMEQNIKTPKQPNTNISAPDSTKKNSNEQVLITLQKIKTDLKIVQDNINLLETQIKENKTTP